MEKTSILIEKIAKLAQKVETLAERNAKLNEDNKLLKYKIERLIQERAEQQSEIESLKEEIASSNIANAFVTTLGSEREAKKTVEKILREIDDCITLINR